MISPKHSSARRTARVAFTMAAPALLLLGACGDSRVSQLEAQVQELTAKLNATQDSVTRLEDVKAIEKLQRAYGYFVDKALWSQIVELFTDDGTVQLGGGGLYKGKEGVARQFQMSFGQGMGRGAGKDGLRKGVLFNHPQLQGIVDIDADGKTAHGRWRTLAQAAWQERPVTFWNEGLYENEYVKENGVWKIKHMKFWSTYFTSYYEGWDKQKKPVLGGERSVVKSDKNPFGPDEQTAIEDANSQYPEHYFVPPFHYPNPVSGKPIPIPEPF